MPLFMRQPASVALPVAPPPSVFSRPMSSTPPIVTDDCANAVPTAAIAARAIRDFFITYLQG